MFNVSSLGLYVNVLVFQNLVILIGFITLASNHLNIAEYFSDLVLCYKIVYQTVDLKRDDFLNIPLLSTTRGHSCKIQHKCIPHRSCRYHFFSNRVIHMWNSLPQHIVTAKDVEVFKSLLSKHDLSNLCKLFPYR